MEDKPTVEARGPQCRNTRLMAATLDGVLAGRVLSRADVLRPVAQGATKISVPYKEGLDAVRQRNIPATGARRASSFAAAGAPQDRVGARMNRGDYPH